MTDAIILVEVFLEKHMDLTNLDKCLKQVAVSRIQKEPTFTVNHVLKHGRTFLTLGQIDIIKEAVRDNDLKRFGRIFETLNEIPDDQLMKVVRIVGQSKTPFLRLMIEMTCETGYILTNEQADRLKKAALKNDDWKTARDIAVIRNLEHLLAKNTRETFGNKELKKFRTALEKGDVERVKYFSEALTTLHMNVFSAIVTEVKNSAKNVNLVKIVMDGASASQIDYIDLITALRVEEKYHLANALSQSTKLGSVCSVSSINLDRATELMEARDIGSMDALIYMSKGSQLNLMMHIVNTVPGDRDAIALMDMITSHVCTKYETVNGKEKATETTQTKEKDIITVIVHADSLNRSELVKHMLEENNIRSADLNKGVSESLEKSTLSIPSAITLSSEMIRPSISIVSGHQKVSPVVSARTTSPVKTRSQDVSPVRSGRNSNDARSTTPEKTSVPKRPEARNLEPVNATPALQAIRNQRVERKKPKAQAQTKISSVPSARGIFKTAPTPVFAAEGPVSQTQHLPGDKGKQTEVRHPVRLRGKRAVARGKQAVTTHTTQVLKKPEGQKMTMPVTQKAGEHVADVARPSEIIRPKPKSRSVEKLRLAPKPPVRFKGTATMLQASDDYFSDDGSMESVRPKSSPIDMSVESSGSSSASSGGLAGIDFTEL